MKRLDHYWYSQNPVAWVLLPLSLVFCIVATLRRLFYRTGILRSQSVPAPVVIVGNITVGGTGKTPLLIALCELLVQSGYKPGIVSRGYRSNITGEHRVTDSDTAETVGDEPLLIRHRTGCEVVIGANRYAAAMKLVHETGCNIVLSDDGLQHYRLARDIELAVVDAQRGFGNGFCLPAGPLRERKARLDQVDMVVIHGADDPGYCFSLSIKQAINLSSGEKKSLNAFSNQRVHAVAGIGHPQRYFSQLSKHGIELIEHAFDDHHHFVEEDMDFNDELPVLMTEKDAVKCNSFSASNLWSVPASVVLSKSLENDFLQRVKRLK